MIAAFLKQLYPGPLSKTVCAIADVGDRGQDFPPEIESDAECHVQRISTDTT